MPVPYGSTLHIPPTNLLLLAAKQESYKKAYLCMYLSLSLINRKQFAVYDSDIPVTLK